MVGSDYYYYFSLAAYPILQVSLTQRGQLFLVFFVYLFPLVLYSDSTEYLGNYFFHAIDKTADRPSLEIFRNVS